MNEDKELGTKNIEELLSLGKVVTISILQAVSKDGFQLSDLGAFLKSDEFEKAVGPAIQGLDLALQEASDIDLIEGLKLARLGYAMVDEIITEAKLASKKLKGE